MSDELKQNLIAQAKQIEDIHNIYESIEETIENNDKELIKIKQRRDIIRNLLGINEYKMKTILEDKAINNLSGLKEEEILTRILTYEEITKENLLYLEKNNLLDFEFDSLFTKEELIRIERELSSPIAREKWDKWDYLAVFLGSISGIIADFFTGGIDKQLQKWLGNFKNTDLLSNWERTSKAAIDFQGPGFAGPYHRGLSSGHDILRILMALWQIKNGTFVGLKQTASGFEWIKTTSNQLGTSFDTYQGLEVFLVWCKHIITDFCGPTSLPVPGMSFLIDMPNHEIRKFAIQIYQRGYNLRFLLSQALAPALVEIIVRGYLLGREYKDTGEIQLPTAKKLKTTEMLLLSHALVMAVNVGKVAIQCNAEGPLALKNLNLPSIIMTFRYFIPFVVKRMKLNDPVEILKRNAKELMEGYDKILADLKRDLENDKEFNSFLHDGKQLII
ncbi:MAG: hypothetical protein IAE93_05990 [Ignavibacteria bacterium]|nr:hypothetical protein [Ignavibacteria bacterium]